MKNFKKGICFLTLLVILANFLFYRGNPARAFTYYFRDITSGSATSDSNLDAARSIDNEKHLIYERNGSLYYRNLSQNIEEQIASGTNPSISTYNNVPYVTYLYSGQVIFNSRENGDWNNAQTIGGVNADSADLDMNQETGDAYVVYSDPDADEDAYNELFFVNNSSGSFTGAALLCDSIAGAGTSTQCNTPNIKISYDGLGGFYYNILYNIYQSDDNLGEYHIFDEFQTDFGGGMTTRSPDFNADDTSQPGSTVDLRNALASKSNGEVWAVYADPVDGNIYYTTGPYVGDGNTWAQTVIWAGENPATECYGTTVGVTFRDGSGDINYAESTDAFSGVDGLEAGNYPALAMDKLNEDDDAGANIFYLINNSGTDEIRLSRNYDNDNPVGTVTVSPDVLSEATTTLSVVVTYNEDMDSASSPTINFGRGADSLSSNGDGHWDSDTIWIETFDLTDNDEELDTYASSSGATDIAGNGESASLPASFRIDTMAPTVSEECISVIGDSGMRGAFKYGDHPVGRWDNAACDSNADIAAVNIDMGGFRSADNYASATDTAGIWTAGLTGAMDDNDTTGVVITVSATDEAGNYSETTSADAGYTIDSIPPVFDAGQPVVALKRDGSATFANSNLWYYFPGDHLKLKVNYDEEDDGSQLESVRLCTRSLTEDDPDAICSPTDFTDEDDYIELDIDQGGGSFANASSSFPAVPSRTGGYLMNIALMDDAGNFTYSSSSDESFTAVWGVNPRENVSVLNTASTTDWSEIDDFTNIPADGLVFSAQYNASLLGEIIFKEVVDLTDNAMIDSLISLGENLNIESGSIRLDSSALSGLDKSAQIVFWLPTATRPGIIVKDNSGTVQGYVETGRSSIQTIGADTLDAFSWDGNSNSFSFTTTGWSQFDMDQDSPSVGTASITPAYSNGGMTYISGVAGASSISASAIDAGSGIDSASCRYSLDGGATWSSADWSTSTGRCYKNNITAAGATSILFTADDNVGWRSTGTALAVTIDTAPPTVDAGSPLNINGATYHEGASASDSGSGIAGYLWSQASGPGTLSFSSANSLHTIINADTEGSYTALLTVTDQAGNSASDSLVIIFDTTAPAADALGDGSDDYAILSGSQAFLDFSESLATTSLNNVESALARGSDLALDYIWNATNSAVAIANNNGSTATFANDVRSTVWDLAGNTSTDLLLVDSSLSASQVEATSSVTLSSSRSEAVVTGSATTTINIPDGVQGATINVGALIDNGAGTLPAININATTSVGAVDIEIPADTGIAAALSTWDGTIHVPTVKSNSTVTVTPDTGKSATVEKVIEIGFDDIKLTFDRSIRIRISGASGKDAGYSRSGVFTKITNVCTADSQLSADAQLAGGIEDCYYDDGTDLILWTKHFTSFITYTQASSGGGGGGGGGTPPGQTCRQVVYSGWGPCRNGYQARTILSWSPQLCSPTADQLAGMKRTCGQNNNDKPKEDKPVPPKDKPRDDKQQVLGRKIYPDGTLIRDQKTKKIYVIIKGKKKYIPNLKELAKYRGRKINNISSEDMMRVD